MDSDQVFDHRKFDSGALQSGTAPTDTPRTDELVRDCGGDVALPIEAQWFRDYARTLERELAAARAEAEKLQVEVDRRFGIGGELIIARRQRDEAIAEADELARRVVFATRAEAVPYLATASYPGPSAEEIITRVRAEMEKEKGNG